MAPGLCASKKRCKEEGGVSQTPLAPGGPDPPSSRSHTALAGSPPSCLELLSCITLQTPHSEAVTFVGTVVPQGRSPQRPYSPTVNCHRNQSSVPSRLGASRENLSLCPSLRIKFAMTIQVYGTVQSIEEGVGLLGATGLCPAADLLTRPLKMNVPVPTGVQSSGNSGHPTGQSDKDVCQGVGVKIISGCKQF